MKIVLVCIAKDENQYFDEWIRHHLKVGFDNVIIYDNNSKEPIEIAEDLKAKVEIRKWIDTEFGSQSRAYLHACYSGQEMYNYMAFFDVDEFYMSLTMDVKQDFKDINKYVTGLGIYWRIYGNPEPFETRQPIENYTKYYGDKHIKSIVDPDMVINFPDPHKANLWGIKTEYINENGEPILSPIGQHTSNKIWIKHIFTRSRQEFAEKIIRGDANTRQQNRTWADFEHYNSLCINED